MLGIDNIKELAAMAADQKDRLLNTGGYTPVANKLYRNIMPDLLTKYPGRDVRDALIIYGYLQAYVCGNKKEDHYMWAFPTREQIGRDTGIHKDRIYPLTKLLEDEGFIKTIKIPWEGYVKRLYLPLYVLPRCESNKGNARDAQDKKQDALSTDDVIRLL